MVKEKYKKSGRIKSKGIVKEKCKKIEGKVKGERKVKEQCRNSAGKVQEK